MMATLTPDDRRRYSRNILLPQIAEEGQLSLQQSCILIVGAGALGSVASMYLAGSGIGKLKIVDFDTVDLSNLQRQLSFGTADCGRSKCEVTAEKIQAINPSVEVEIVDGLLTKDSLASTMPGVNLVLEGSDNPTTKYLVTDKCAATDTPYVLGGISQWEGQVMSWGPGHKGQYRTFFPEAAEAGGFTPCALGGVLGPLPGIIGSIMAAEAVKIIAGAGKPLYDRLLTVNSLDMTFRTFRL